MLFSLPGLDFSIKERVELRHKGRCLGNQHRKRHRFPPSLSWGNGGATGLNVETLCCKRKKNPADGGGNDEDDDDENERWRWNGWAFTPWRARLCQSLFLCWYVFSLTTGTWEETGVLSADQKKKNNLPTYSSACFRALGSGFLGRPGILTVVFCSGQTEENYDGN